MDNFTTDEIYEELKKRIIKRQYLAGSKFNQRKLSEEFSVSRTPVVKALTRLSSDGLVDNITNKGFIVHSLNLKELSELFEIRQYLELIAVKNIINQNSPAIYNQIASCFADFKDFDTNNITSEIEQKYHDADVNFHNTLIELSNNTMVKKINNYMQILNLIYTAGFLRNFSEVHSEHLQILEAIKIGKLDLALECCEKHLGITKNRILKLVNEMEKMGVSAETIYIKDLNFKN